MEWKQLLRGESVRLEGSHLLLAGATKMSVGRGKAGQRETSDESRKTGYQKKGTEMCSHGCSFPKSGQSKCSWTTDPIISSPHG